MPRKAAGLTAAKVRTAKPGRYGDGGGLYLLVRSPEARFWVFRYTIAGTGRLRDMGLGAASGPAAISLAEAREKAAELRRRVKDGIDPLQRRQAEAAAAKAAEQKAAAKAKTFRDVADLFISAHEAGWRNPKHREQWRNTLATYVHPHMGDLPVGEVETAHVMAALTPIWKAKPETATRVRGRIESVLDYAKTSGWRESENPARWRGHIANLLPPPGKVSRVKHHPALPWQQVGTFMHALGQEEGTAAFALSFTILTATRTNEVIGARWSEMDLQDSVWTVPGERMKAEAEHRVPLTKPALAILRTVAKLRTAQKVDGYVFPGAKVGKPLSNMAMLELVRRMNEPTEGEPSPEGELPRWHDPKMGRPITVHGFRSSFRDWCAEATHYPRELAEAALAHTLGDKVEAAYRRGDLFNKRRKMMEDWATWCSRLARPAEVVPLRQNTRTG